MAEVKINRKGVALFLALAVVLVVCILADIILTIMASQNKLTGHQVNRIRAYYAAQAGMNYALEMLKLGDVSWIPSPDTAPNTRTRTLCESGCDVNDSDIPYPVTIIIEAPGTSIDGVGRRINITANYTFTP